jgi:hypothetical protein
VASAGKGRPRLVLLDLNSPEFQSQFFALERPLLAQVVEVLDRLRKMAWSDVYRSSGLKWEKIGRNAPNGEPLYSLRITQKARAIGFREGDYLRLVSLHPDHDSAYD